MRGNHPQRSGEAFLATPFGHRCEAQARFKLCREGVFLSLHPSHFSLQRNPVLQNKMERLMLQKEKISFPVLPVTD